MQRDEAKRGKFGVSERVHKRSNATTVNVGDCLERALPHQTRKGATSCPLDRTSGGCQRRRWHSRQRVARPPSTNERSSAHTLSDKMSPQMISEVRSYLLPGATGASCRSRTKGIPSTPRVVHGEGERIAGNRGMDVPHALQMLFPTSSLLQSGVALVPQFAQLSAPTWLRTLDLPLAGVCELMTGDDSGPEVSTPGSGPETAASIFCGGACPLAGSITPAWIALL